nr:myosin-binding protein 2-like isoform X1 [Tanacetum cinerariifolium]
MNRSFWTFESLVGAFLDLFIAYFLLCGSTIALFAIKILALFGLTLPSAYDISTFRNLLVDYPTERVSSVQYSVIRKFPFDAIFSRANNTNNGNENDDGVNLDNGGDNGNRFMELEGEGEASCSSKSDARKVVRNEVDVKGKGGLSYRTRGGFRRRRRGGFDSGKESSVSSSTNWATCVVDQGSHNDNKEFGGGFDGSSVASGGNIGTYETESHMVEKSYSPNDIKKMIPANEADKDSMIVQLARELEEQQATRAALYVELEKERNAAATAADEAMSMILRLQEEKASIEMELRQYQRMIEEKSAYDEEEMNILKEIVLRREREKHFLEKEVEAYRQMTHQQNDQFNGGDNQDSNEDNDLMETPRVYEDAVADIVKEEEPEKTIAIVGEEKSLEIEADDALDSRIYDVHIDHGPKSSQKLNGTKTQSDQNRSGSECSVGLPPVSSNSKSSLRRNSTSALDNERTKLDTEVDWLRERLRVVQEGREKLNFSIDNREKESLQLQLLEDIARQLQEIRMLTEPKTAHQASLPLPSSKSSTKKRRCRTIPNTFDFQKSISYAMDRIYRNVTLIQPSDSQKASVINKIQGYASKRK